MEYFNLFDIPVQLRIPKGSLTGKYFELSRRFHPDYFVNAGDAAQSEALERSALLNKAYMAFQNPDETIKYVLQQKGLLEEEEKYELPADFLGEVLEINELLMEVEEPAEPESRSPSIETRINELQKEIYEPVKEIVEHYQEGVTSEQALLQVKAYYYKKKYLDRIHRELAGMA